MLARRALLPLAILSSLALVALPASATVMVEIPMEELVSTSDLIVHATVLRTGTQLEPFEGHLETHTITELRPVDFLRGSGDDVVRIDEIGGTNPDGSGSWIEGTPRYRDGEEVIVFLRRLPNGAFRTVGMEQGRFEVIHEVDASGGRTVVERDTSHVGFASWVDGHMQVRDGARSPSVEYDVFVGFVASVLEQLPTVPGTTGTTGGGR